MSRAEYWTRQIREPVRFVQAMETLAAQGVTHFVEVGPHPVLLGMGAHCLPGASPAWLPSLRRRSQATGAICWKVSRGCMLMARRRTGRLSIVAIRASAFRCRLTRSGGAVIGWTSSAGGPSQGSKWADLTNALDRQSLQAPLDLNAASYPEKWQALSRVTTAHAVAFFRDAGLFLTAGEKRTSEEILEVSRRSAIHTDI